MSVKQEKLERIFKECDKHLFRMNGAYKQMNSLFPLDKDKYINLTDIEVQAIDQFLFRFSKLQDTIGNKLFKAFLLYLEEDVETLPFIDILNKMEKLNILQSVEEWRKLRDIRNELSHNYDDEPEEMSISINKIYNQRETIEKIYIKIVDYYQKINKN